MIKLFFLLSIILNQAGSMSRSTNMAMIRAEAVTMPKLLFGMNSLKANIANAALSIAVVYTMAVPA